MRQRLDVPHRLHEQEPERPVQPAVEDELEIAPLGEVIQIFDEPLLMPGFNEVDIFACQKVKDKIWNCEYIDLALMLRSNFNNQHNSEDTIGLSDGALVIQKKVKKLHTINTIEDLTETFIAFAQIMIERHPEKASEFYSYMSIIRGAAKENSVDKWYTYDQQFRLRVSKDHTKKWSSIDVFLWLRIMTINTPKTNNNYGYKCYEFTFKGLCKRSNCLHRHVCLKCNFPHPAINCRKFMEGESGNNVFGSFMCGRLPSSFEQRQGWSHNANLSARKKPLKNSNN